MPSGGDATQEPGSYWLIPGRLIGGEWPLPYLDWLESQRVSVLVNLTPRAYQDDRFRIHHIPVRDGAAPDEPQIRRFCRLVGEELQATRNVYVHCAGGYGRTGTMMACYLVYRHRHAAAEALRQIRGLRPGSVETDAQEDAVTEWALLMQALGYQLPET